MLTEAFKLSPYLLLVNYKLIYFLPVPLTLVGLKLSIKESPFERVLSTGIKTKYKIHSRNTWKALVWPQSSIADHSTRTFSDLKYYHRLCYPLILKSLQLKVSIDKEKGQRDYATICISQAKTC